MEPVSIALLYVWGVYSGCTLFGWVYQRAYSHTGRPVSGCHPASWGFSFLFECCVIGLDTRLPSFVRFSNVFRHLDFFCRMRGWVYDGGDEHRPSSAMRMAIGAGPAGVLAGSSGRAAFCQRAEDGACAVRSIAWT